MIEAKLHGVKKEDVEVGIEDDPVFISGGHTFGDETSKQNYLRTY